MHFGSHLQEINLWVRQRLWGLSPAVPPSPQNTIMAKANFHKAVSETSRKTLVKRARDEK